MTSLRIFLKRCWPSKVYSVHEHRFKMRLLILLLTTLAAANELIREEIPSMSISRFGEKYDEALEAIFSVAVRLEALLSDTDSKDSKNFLVSPLSMAVAVGELLLGARGPFQDELFDLLVIDSTKNRSETVRHFKNQEIKYHALHEQLGDLLQTLGSNTEKFNLKTASCLFVQTNLTVNEQYKRNVKKYYGTDVMQVDFLQDFLNAERIVNQWAFDNTNGLIKHILPGGLSPLTVALLANAVYLKADWEIPFSSEVNRILPFKINEHTSVNTTFMLGEFENYKYVENTRLNCRMVAIPYKNNELSMYIVMPNINNNEEYNINRFVSNLRTKDIVELIQSAKERKVFMLLPKMSLSNTVKVLGPLRKYHSYKNHVELQRRANSIPGDEIDRLNERVNFFKNISSLSTSSPTLSLNLSGISTSEDFHLGELVQQTTLKVHEIGTEAAAVSASAIDYILDSVSFKVDRPFLFFIRHESSEANLFWGTIQDPTEENN